MTVSLDLNVRRKLWPEAAAASVLRALAARVDIVLGGIDEVALVTRRGVSADPGALAAAALDLGPATAILKLGADGALGMERGGSPVVAPALPVTVVDPIGAGDAFTAGFISARMDDAPLGRALAVANACGAAAVAAVGDMSGLPTRDELERLLGGSSLGDTIR